MSTNGWLLLDLVLSVLAAAGFITAAVLSGRRRRFAFGAAAIGTAARLVTLVPLWRAGWWFVQEKVTLTLPLILVAVLWCLVARGPYRTVALFTAGFAAAAAPVVTLLVGYPATWSIALVTLAVVAAGAVLTARLVGLTGLRAPTVGAFTLLVVGVGASVLAPSTVDYGGGTSAANGSEIPVTSLTGPTAPAPGGAVRRYALAARTAPVTVAGRTVTAWTFNGQVPGPAITAHVGDLIEVTLTNVDIADGVTLHWHGYDVPNAEDGAPGLTQAAVLPGQSFVYRFRADQAGTYWYHTHEVSDRGVKLGLFGSLVVYPLSPVGLDLVVALHTLDGSFLVGTGGRAVPAGTPVRLRLVNTDGHPRLVDVVGTGFRVVAVDGSDLTDPGPLTATALLIPAGGRYDVSFAMPAGGMSLRFPDDPDVAFRLGAGSSLSTAGWPVLDLFSYGAPASQPFGPDSAFDRRFTLVLDRGLTIVDGLPAYAYTVDGHAHPSIPTEVVRYGDLVEFTIVNRSTDVHPWHLHGHRVLILSRDGRTPTGSPLWMDTFDVRPGEVWRVGFRADNPGLWMNHCHNLAHADNGMALHLAYAGVSSPFHGGHGG